MIRLWDAVGPWTRKAIVVGMFVAVPAWIWWTVSGLLPGARLDAPIARLLTLALLGSLAFGAASALLVWRDLDAEP